MSDRKSTERPERPQSKPPRPPERREYDQGTGTDVGKGRGGWERPVPIRPTDDARPSGDPDDQ